jgi:hypothetical protein
MRRFPLAALFAAVLFTAACSNSTTAPTTTTTTTTTVTDTFAGTLNRNGASSFAFSVQAAGLVYATLTSVADSTITVGVSLGTWTGTSCTVVLSNDQALQGTTITGSVTAAGTLCARVYDVGKVANPLDYQITVVHP